MRVHPGIVIGIGITLISSLVFSDLYVQKLRSDEKRFTEASNIKTQIKSYYSQNGKLPDDLMDLGNVAVVSPEYRKIFTYTPVSSNSFKTCVTYNFDTQTDTVQNKLNERLQSIGVVKTIPAHPAGEQCEVTTLEIAAIPKRTSAPQRTISPQKTSVPLPTTEFIYEVKKPEKLFTVLTPKEGDVLQKYQPYVIKWKYNGTSPVLTHISVENSGITTISKNIQTIPNVENSFTWTPGANATADNSNRIMISRYSQDSLHFEEASYSGTFTILEPGEKVNTLPPSATQLELLFPKGGERFKIGEKYNVRYKFNGNKAAPPHTGLDFKLYKSDKFIGYLARTGSSALSQEWRFEWIVGQGDLFKKMELTPGDDYVIKVQGVKVFEVKNWNDPFPIVPGIATQSGTFTIY